MSSYGVVGRVGLLVEPTFRGAQRKVRDGLGVPLAKEGPKQGRNLGDMIVSGTTRVFKWGGVAVGAALGTAITKGFGRIRAMEDATAKIEGLGYSAKEVDQIMSDVQGALDGTMFLYSEGADVAAGALAAGVQEGEELEKYLRLTADAATQANIPFGDMGHMMNKVSSSGKLTGDVLMQLEQNGVYVGAAIADSLGVTQEEFRKMVSAGEVSADVFMDVMEDQFGGSSERAADTMTGAMSLAWTAVGQLGEKLIQHVYPYLKEFFQAFYQWVQDISPAVEDFGERVGKALGSVIGWIVDHPGAVKAFAAAFGTLIAAMAAYTAYVKTAAIVQGLLNTAMTANPVGLIIAGLVALTAAVIYAWNNFDWFRDAMTTAWDWIKTAALWTWDILKMVFSGIGTWAVSMWENGIKPVFGFFANAWNWIVKAATLTFDDVLNPIFEGIGALAVWLWENAIQPTFGFFADAWNWIADAAVFVWESILQPVFEGIGTVVTWLWENIISPYIGFIISMWELLGQIYSFTWENVIKPVFQWFGDVAVWLWENVLSQVFSWIGALWSNMVTGMAWAWENILAPVWDVISAVAMWLWENVLSPVFSWIGEKWQYVLLGMQFYWENVLKPVFTAVATIARWLWDAALSPVFTWIGNHWDTILTGMVWAWNNILKPAWDFLADIAFWLWNKVLSPVFTWIGNHWSNMVDGMVWVWNHILKPTWDFLADIALWLWNSVLSPVFSWIGNKWSEMSDRMSNIYHKYIKPVIDWFGDKVENLKSRFETAVDNIKKQWDKLKGIAAKPIKFVIQDIFNDGLINALNKIPGVNIPDIPEPGWVSEYATGGYTGDGHWLEPKGIVHGGEYVLNKRSTNRLRDQIGMSGLDHMNRTGRLPGYAKGGLVQPVRGPVTSGFGASRGRYPHAGIDFAVPIGTAVAAALDGTVLRAGTNIVAGRTGKGMLLGHSNNRHTYYGHLSSFVAGIGDAVSKGMTIARSGNTGRSTGPHLHFETWSGNTPQDPAKYLNGAILPGGQKGLADDGGGWFDPLAPFRALGEKITSWLTDKFPNAEYMLDASIGMAKQGFDSMLEWAKSKVGLASDDGDSGGTGNASGSVISQVRDVAKRFGWDSGDQWTALSQLINKESSWDPSAANPSSSARGLFQKMTSIHGPVESTAGGQANWGLNYIKRSYGTPAAAWAFHKRNNWYDRGGFVDPQLLFRDRGGNLPPGLSMVLNKTGQDEAILNARQWSDIHTLAQRGAGSGAAVNIQNAYALSSEQLARDITKQQRRAQALQLI